MFRQIFRFFKRVFQSKGFRITAKVILGILIANFLFSYFNAISYFSHHGMTRQEAVSLVFDVVFRPFSRLSLSIIAGVVIGIMAYFRGRRKKEASAEEEEEAEEDKPAETPEPESAPEEEFTETTHYMSR